MVDGEARSRVWGILLAAGASRRMGSAKQFLEFDGVSLLRRAIHCLDGAGLDGIVVTVRASMMEQVQAHLAAGGSTQPLVQLVEIPDVATQLMSLQIGLEALPDACGGVLVTLCDLPGQSQALVAAVVALFRKSTTAMAYPMVGKRRAHPVIFAASLFPLLLELSGKQRPRDLVERFAGGAAILDWCDDSILVDLDEPDDVKRWRRCMQQD